MIRALVLVTALVVATPALAAGGDQCSVLRETDGKGQLVAAPEIDLLHADPSRALPPAPSDITGVVCDRALILPGPADWRVLADWKIPLALRADGRVMWLQMDKGRLQVEFRAGQIRPGEEASLQQWLNETQPKLYAK